VEVPPARGSSSRRHDDETDIADPGAAGVRRRGWSDVRGGDDGPGADPRRLRPEAAPLQLADDRGSRLDSPVEHDARRGADGVARGGRAPDDGEGEGPGDGVGAPAAWAIRVAYIIGGMLTADPVAGFPPGTTPEMVQRTWHGAVQNASRGASSLL